MEVEFKSQSRWEIFRLETRPVTSHKPVFWCDIVSAHLPGMFKSLDLLVEYWIWLVIMELPYIDWYPAGCFVTLNVLVMYGPLISNLTTIYWWNFCKVILHKLVSKFNIMEISFSAWCTYIYIYMLINITPEVYLSYLIFSIEKILVWFKYFLLPFSIHMILTLSIVVGNKELPVCGRIKSHKAIVLFKRNISKQHPQINCHIK